MSKAQLLIKPARQYVNMATTREKLCEPSCLPAVRQISGSPCPSSARTARQRQRGPFPRHRGQRRPSRCRPRLWRLAAPALKTKT